MHWFRDGNRQRTRILYVFRTPGGVRVGRDPLEPEVLREIEAQHPDIAFEWKAIRDNQQIIEPAIEQRRRRPKRMTCAQPLLQCRAGACRAVHRPPVGSRPPSEACALDDRRRDTRRTDRLPDRVVWRYPSASTSESAIRRGATLHALAERLNPWHGRTPIRSPPGCSRRGGARAARACFRVGAGAAGAGQ